MDFTIEMEASLFSLTDTIMQLNSSIIYTLVVPITVCVFDSLEKLCPLIFFGCDWKSN